MDASPEESGDPPPYAFRTRDGRDEVLPPVILVLDGTVIRAQSAGTRPLFELSRDIIDGSSGVTTPILLKRLIYKVRTTRNGTPREAQRGQPLFQLQHLGRVLSKGYPWCLEATSRSSVGNLALKTVALHRSRLKVVRTASVEGHGLPKGYVARRKSLKDAELVFDIVEKENRYEWSNGEGERVAVEDCFDGRCRLLVLAPLTRQTMDALVGSWCLRLWRATEESTKGEATSLVKFAVPLNVRKAREILPRYW
ncbi:hypothetical protein F5Y15DRAFT_309071 [Xylariaceae sp. FL0016]|nr:hypothetical protein F5Y15DRAFT_309071 [Xylariaceae sp. FL0016]